MNFRKNLFYPMIDSLLWGLASACIVIAAAFEHNPQGEFYNIDTGDAIYSTTAPLFLLAFVSVVIIVFAIEGLLNYFFQRLFFEKKKIILMPLLNAIALGCLAGFWRFSYIDYSILDMQTIANLFASNFFWVAFVVFAVELSIRFTTRMMPFWENKS